MHCEILGAPHLEKTRGCTIELEAFRSTPFDEQIFGHCSGRSMEPHAMIVKRIDKNDETLRLLPLFRAEQRDASKKNCIEALGGRVKALDAKRLLAKIDEG